MDKYEYKVRSEEISKLIGKEKYAEAVKIADTIDWRRVKSSAMLLKIAALYRVSRRNEDSREMLMLAYERYPTNRSVVYSLCELSIELDDVVAAIEYYKQFVKLAPKDNGVHTLRYRILEAQEASLEERIEILEELKKKDYQEEWAYELAYLYHRAGLSTKCVEECDDIILWFGDGAYVMKAMELKAKHVPLTDAQLQNYNIMLGNAGQNYSSGNYDADDYDAGHYNAEGYAGQDYGADYSGEDYGGQNYEPDYSGGGYDNQNYGAEGYDGQDYSTEGYGDQNYSGEGYAGQDYSGEGYDGRNYDAEGYAGQDYRTEGYDDQDYSGEGYAGQSYAAEGYNAGNYDGQGYGEGGYGGYGSEGDPNGSYANEVYGNGYGQEDYFGEQYADDSYTQNNYIDDGYGNLSYVDGGYPDNGYTGEFYVEQAYDENGNPVSPDLYTGNDQAQDSYPYPQNGQSQDADHAGQASAPKEYRNGLRLVENPAASSSDMSQYNTINLQKVVAESMKELFPDDKEDVFAENRDKYNFGDTRIFAGVKENPAGTQTTGRVNVAQIVTGVSEAAPQPNTGAIRKVLVPGGDARTIKSDPDMDELRDTTEQSVEDEHVRMESNDENVYHEKSIIDTGEEGKTPQAPTRPMKLDDVLVEWERMKQDNAKKNQEQIKKRVLTQTGKIFTDFDNSIKSGILGELEREEAEAERKNQASSVKKRNDGFLDADITGDIPQQPASDDDFDVGYVKKQKHAATSEVSASYAEGVDVDQYTDKAHTEDTGGYTEEALGEGTEQHVGNVSMEEAGQHAGNAYAEDSGGKIPVQNAGSPKREVLEKETHVSAKDVVAEDTSIYTEKTFADGTETHTERAFAEGTDIHTEKASAEDTDIHAEKAFAEDTDTYTEKAFADGADVYNIGTTAKSAGEATEEILIQDPDTYSEETYTESSDQYTEEINVHDTAVEDIETYAENADVDEYADDADTEDMEAYRQDGYTGDTATEDAGTYIDTEDAGAEGYSRKTGGYTDHIYEEDSGGYTEEIYAEDAYTGQLYDDDTDMSYTEEVEYPQEGTSAYADGYYGEDIYDDLEDAYSDTYEDPRYAERRQNDQYNERGLDPEDAESIAEMAKEDALKTQEIKMNTEDLSALSEKIVATTKKEASGARREEVRDFTPEEQTLFENFAVTKKIKKQIIYALENVTLAAYTGNVIITGDAGLDTVRMAKNLIKEYQALDEGFSGKIAKITGEKINQRNIKDIFEKLNNGGIIIEKANGMSEEKLYELASNLNQDTLGIIVIMEDTKKEITRLLEKQAMIVDYFNIRIDLMEMDTNALVAYAKNYALALEYSIDELGTLALFTRITNMQSGNHVVTKDEVRDIIDEAIWKSKKSKIKNFVDVLFARRYDDEDMIVLKERDFM